MSGRGNAVASTENPAQEDRRTLADIRGVIQAEAVTSVPGIAQVVTDGC